MSNDGFIEKLAEIDNLTLEGNTYEEKSLDYLKQILNLDIEVILAKMAEHSWIKKI